MAQRRRLQDMTPGRRKKRIEETIVLHSAPENYDDILEPFKQLEKPQPKTIGWKAQEQINKRMSTIETPTSTKKIDSILSAPPARPELALAFLHESPTKTLEGLAILREARRKRKLNENRYAEKEEN